jgi:hypothetical protein
MLRPDRVTRPSAGVRGGWPEPAREIPHSAHSCALGPPIHEERLPGDVRSLVRAQPRGGGRHLPALPRPPHGDAAHDHPAFDQVVDPGPIDRRHRRAGRCRSSEYGVTRTPARATASGSASRPCSPSSRGSVASSEVSAPVLAVAGVSVMLVIAGLSRSPGQVSTRRPGETGKTVIGASAQAPMRPRRPAARVHGCR